MGKTLFRSVLYSTVRKTEMKNRNEKTMTRKAYFPSRCRIGTQRSTLALCKDDVSPKVSHLRQLVASSYSKGLTILWLIIIDTMHPAKVEQPTTLIRNPQPACLKIRRGFHRVLLQERDFRLSPSPYQK